MPRIRCHIDDHITALAGRQPDLAARRREWFDWLSVDRNHRNPRLVEEQVHGARIGDVEQAQTDALTAGYRINLFGLPVHGDDVAHTTAVRPVVHRTQAFAVYLHVGVESPVVDRKHQVLVYRRRVVLLDDQHARKSQRQLGPGTLVRVVPVGTGIGRRQAVLEFFAGHYRRLGHPGNTIHGIFDAQTVPVHGAGFIECILENDNRFPAARNTDHRTWNRLVVIHDLGWLLLITRQFDLPMSGAQVEIRHCARRPARGAARRRPPVPRRRP